MHRIWILAACLWTFSGCSILPQRKPERIEVPVYQPVDCNDQVRKRCDGVPSRAYVTATAVVLGLGEALRALRGCQDRQAELLRCLDKHDAQAKAQNAKAGK